MGRDAAIVALGLAGLFIFWFLVLLAVIYAPHAFFFFCKFLVAVALALILASMARNFCRMFLIGAR